MNNYLGIIRMALWEKEGCSYQATEEDYSELTLHTILCLTARCFNKLEMSKDLRNKWSKAILQRVSYNYNYFFCEHNLPITVPYVILKGTAASQYYPYPEYREMGDIDIITSRDCYSIACKQLLENGYKIVKKLERETGLIKNGIMVEVHSYFSLLNDMKAAEYLDDLIVRNIGSTHYLPDLINGLVLLEHIDQHMEGGIGLRQVIDWMMFVNKCLPDSLWPEFQVLVSKIGLEQLAIVITRMCEMYLGLSSRHWCEKADVKLCERLMEYIKSCGNFGNKQNDDSSISKKAFTYARTPRATYMLLQERGLANWKAAKKHKILKPFAWIYQMGRYISRGLMREGAKYKLIEEYSAANSINNLFDTLGIKRVGKGQTVYKNGEYQRKKR